MKTRVGVIRGGIGHEYDVSLRTGGQVLTSLPEQYKPIDILITKDGRWHSMGLPIKPADLVDQVDVVFNALHGEYGEDGQIQKIFDDLYLPYTGSKHLASSLGMDKMKTKQLLKEAGFKVPHSVSLYIDEDSREAAKKIFTKISPPWIIKPIDRGSSIGVFFVRLFDDLPEAIEKAFAISDTLLVEEYIKGREVTCGVVNGLRNQKHYSLFPTEIIRPNVCPIWNYEDKYSPNTFKICPGRFKEDDSVEIRRQAESIHDLLGLDGYSRTDFILSSRGLYVLENNSLPALTAESPFVTSLKALGVDQGQFLDHILDDTLRKY